MEFHFKNTELILIFLLKIFYSIFLISLSVYSATMKKIHKQYLTLNLIVRLSTTEITRKLIAIY